MFSKPTNTTTPPATPTPSAPMPPLGAAPPLDAAKRGPKVASLIAADITLEGSISGDGELQVDGVIKGDVRVSRLTIGETGTVEGGVYAESVELRGKVVGSVTAKQVRLYGTGHMDGDITHEQLAMETGAFFQGRSLKFQRPATVAAPALAPSASTAPSEPRSTAPTGAPPLSSLNSDGPNGSKPATTPPA